MRELWLVLVLSACGAQATIAPSVGRTWLDPEIELRPDVSTALVVIESYRGALKHGDTVTLLALASDDYLDDAGSPAPDDDIDRTTLALALGHWSAITMTDLDLHVTHVERRGQSLLLTVRYRITVRIEGRVSTLFEEHLMTLTPRGRSWAFASGM